MLKIRVYRARLLLRIHAHCSAYDRNTAFSVEQRFRKNTRNYVDDNSINYAEEVTLLFSLNSFFNVMQLRLVS